jgi:predicted O-methyltransferase YrrM
LPHSNANGIGLWPKEQLTLTWLLGCGVDHSMDWVEVGTFCGGSAILLALARVESELSEKAKVFSIDPNPRLIADVNFKTAKVDHKVSQQKFLSQDFLKFLSDAKSHDYDIGFAFLDGFHSFKQVTLEFELLKKFLPEGGIVAFHDVPPDFHPGPYVPREYGDNEDFLIDDAINYILHNHPDWEFLPIPKGFQCNHFAETGRKTWVRGQTSPFNAIAAIQRKK